MKDKERIEDLVKLKIHITYHNVYRITLCHILIGPGEFLKLDKEISNLTREEAEKLYEKGDRRVVKGILNEDQALVLGTCYVSDSLEYNLEDPPVVPCYYYLHKEKEKWMIIGGGIA